MVFRCGFFSMLDQSDLEQSISREELARLREIAAVYSYLEEKQKSLERDFLEVVFEDWERCDGRVESTGAIEALQGVESVEEFLEKNGVEVEED